MSWLIVDLANPAERNYAQASGWTHKQKEAYQFASYADACRTFVARGLVSSRIVKLKLKPKCETCGKPK